MKDTSLNSPIFAQTRKGHPKTSCVKNQIQKIVNRFGYQVTKYPDEMQRRRIKLLGLHKIDLVIDIGANGGQYGSRLRSMGYEGKILSFEPLASAFKLLQNAASNDAKWNIVNLALGDKNEQSTINVSSNSVSSSLLDMNSNYIAEAANVRFTGSEAITVKRFDTICSGYIDTHRDNLFMKIDAQGYEGKILEGAQENMQFVKGIQIEMALTEMYKGQMLFMPLLQKLYDLGFELQGLEQGFHNPVTMQLYEMDGIFFKK